MRATAITVDVYWFVRFFFGWDWFTTSAIINYPNYRCRKIMIEKIFNGSWKSPDVAFRVLRLMPCWPHASIKVVIYWISGWNSLSSLPENGTIFCDHDMAVFKWFWREKSKKFWWTFFQIIITSNWCWELEYRIFLYYWVTYVNYFI
jgi:hypothetical protein